MTKSRRAALLAELVDQMRGRGSWGGETHLQKATYFLQELMEVPFEYEFILYKHGPFSFDLRDELTNLRADGLLDLEPRPYPYGPSLTSTSSSEELRSRFPKTVGMYSEEIEFVADRLSPKGVNELERLATALYVLDEGAQEPVARLIELKPHVSENQAEAALNEVQEMIGESGHG